jgi:hypothetical protein
VTLLDGHPMTQRGRATLAIAAMGRFRRLRRHPLIALVGPPLASIALKFGSPGIFADGDGARVRISRRSGSLLKRSRWSSRAFCSGSSAPT